MSEQVVNEICDVLAQDPGFMARMAAIEAREQKAKSIQRPVIDVDVNLRALADYCERRCDQYADAGEFAPPELKQWYADESARFALWCVSVREAI